MPSYIDLTRRAQRFLADNPEIKSITMQRPGEKPVKYCNPNQESFQRMPESCPTVQEILNQHLPGDDKEILRKEIFADLHDRVTDKFRDALNEAIQSKHYLLRVVESVIDDLKRGEREARLAMEMTEARRDNERSREERANPVLIIEPAQADESEDGEEDDTVEEIEDTAVEGLDFVRAPQRAASRRRR
jgi:hypothetical protein